MASANAGRADKGWAGEPLRWSRRPRQGALAARPPRGRLGISGPGKSESRHTTRASRAHQPRSGARIMTRYDAEIEQLRAQVHCAIVLERQSPPWRLDRAESTETLPQISARTMATSSLSIIKAGAGGIRRAMPRATSSTLSSISSPINFGHIRKVLREFMGISPSFPEADRSSDSDPPRAIPADRLGAPSAAPAGNAAVALSCG